MEIANLIKQDIESILQIESQDIKQLVEDYREDLMDSETYDAIDAYNMLYSNIYEMSEEEYLDAFRTLGEAYPNFGKADENDVQKSIAELERLKHAFNELQLHTIEGKQLLALQLAVLELDIQVYRKLTLSPTTMEIQAEINLLESESFGLTNQINQFLELYHD